MDDHHFTGGCFCGKVRLAIDAAPSRAGICHCRNCRKQYGGIFHIFAVFPEAAVTVTGETAHYGPRHFCPVCGSSVYDKFGSEIDVGAGALDGENLIRPTYETWICRREQWLPVFPLDHRYDRDPQ